MAAGMDRITGDYNDFWAGRDYLHDIEPWRAALFMCHGFNDWNVVPEHSFRIYQAVKAKGVPAMIYYHQGGHGGAPPMRMMNRWFTRYLHGVENGVEKELRAWIVRERARRSEPTPYPDFPHPDAVMVKLHPTRGGRKIGGLVALRPARQGKETLVDDARISGAELARAESSDHRLLYTTPLLKQELRISGTATLTIRLACNKKAANLSAWLVSLPWIAGRRVRITENIITRGWADPQNHSSLTRSSPLVPGRFYELTFKLQPDDQVIPPGQQIGLMVFSSDRDVTLRPRPGTKLTVDLDRTWLALPVVGGRGAVTQAVQGD
jgi:X-Pro dipeptidyl-peptidase